LRDQPLHLDQFRWAFGLVSRRSPPLGLKVAVGEYPLDQIPLDVLITTTHSEAYNVVATQVAAIVTEHWRHSFASLDRCKGAWNPVRRGLQERYGRHSRRRHGSRRWNDRESNDPGLAGELASAFSISIATSVLSLNHESDVGH
jgi:hypothetical protein